MISIRAPRKVGKQPIPQRIRQWAAKPVACKACGAARKAVGKVAAKLSRPR